MEPNITVQDNAKDNIVNLAMNIRKLIVPLSILTVISFASCKKNTICTEFIKSSKEWEQFKANFCDNNWQLKQEYYSEELEKNRQKILNKTNELLSDCEIERGI